MNQLLAGRWSTSGTTLYEQFNNPANIGIRVNIPRGLGLDRLEVTIKASSEMDVYQRMNSHMGQRIAVYSSWMQTPISGYVVQIEKVGRGMVKYIARGAGFRHSDQRFDFVPAEDDTISNVVTDYLNATNVPILSTDTANLDTNNTLANLLRLQEVTTAYDIIQRMTAYDNAGDGFVFDWFVKDEPFSGLSLGDFTRYYKQRSDTATPDWIVSTKDMSSWRLSRDLSEFATRATVRYGTASGTDGAAGGDNTTQFSAASAGFIAQNVQAGDTVYNITDGSFASVVSVDSATAITHTKLYGGTADTWAVSGASWQVVARNAVQEQTAALSDTPWRRDAFLLAPFLDSATADDFADLLVNNEAVGQQSFTLSSPTIRDSSGARWPLWEVCAQLDKRYIQIEDFYPTASAFSTSNDNLTSFVIVGLDYDHRSRSLSVEVDKPDRRLDVQLRLANITQTDAVRRGR